MAITPRTAESHVKLAAPQLPAGIRSGGENLPLEYPHLYQIQAGDWRISYAVEHNRLAILVLEVLNAEGKSSQDPVREKLTRKMKVKLLDWPEGSGGPVPPDDISRKLKIKWLDLAEEAAEPASGSEPRASRIKLKGPAAAAPESPAARSRITLLDSGEAVVEEQGGAEEDGDGRRVTPLDEPST